jgi:hypothetical protein
MHSSYVIVFASLVFSLHCEGHAPKTRDFTTPVPTLSTSGQPVRPAPRSYEFGSGKAPLVSLSTDEERFHLVLQANGWGDFSRHSDGLKERHITDVRTIEIELPLSACRFAGPTSDARLHACYYVEKSTNEKPAEIRFVLGDKKVITWSDAVPGMSKPRAKSRVASMGYRWPSRRPAHP